MDIINVKVISILDFRHFKPLFTMAVGGVLWMLGCFYCMMSLSSI